MKQYLYPANILLPRYHVSEKDLWTKWATIACDQFTSEPAYWESARQQIGGSPSTLSMILPEVYLSEKETRIPMIREAMHDLLKHVFSLPRTGMIYLSRTQSDGRVRAGIVAAIDLEEYSYEKGSTTLTRATEGTVLERIPPRVQIRKAADVEVSHVMLLIDDPKKTVIEPIGCEADSYETAYDFDLMLGGGHATGKWIPEPKWDALNKALGSLISPDGMKERYGDADLPPLLFAAGDGNHSLATAKSCYESLKQELGVEAAMAHPARYALCELVNLHSDALSFEPIYRVVFGADKDDLLAAFSAYAAEKRRENGKTHIFTWVSGGEKGEITFRNPAFELPVGSLQDFLDRYVSVHPEVTVDYIHGEDATESLAVNGAVGFLFSGMEKEELFRTVIFDGSLPRKTFSMGHARDKRYYLEAQRITVDGSVSD